MPEHPLPRHWQPDRLEKRPRWPTPALAAGFGRGLRGHCPSCGKGPIFNGYLRVVRKCRSCGAPLGAVRADDVPPYFTIVLVGHLVVPGMLITEQNLAPPIWLQMAVWVPLTLFLTLALLRPVKGATVGLMLHLGLMGDEESDPSASHDLG